MVRTPSPAILALLLAPLLADCTAGARVGEQPWQKPGASEQAIAGDSAECSKAAKEDAVRRYPYRGGDMLSQQHDDTSRAIAEASAFNSCMQGRGYHLRSEK
jgi:hypothetical protein